MREAGDRLDAAVEIDLRRRKGEGSGVADARRLARGPAVEEIDGAADIDRDIAPGSHDGPGVQCQTLHDRTGIEYDVAIEGDRPGQSLEREPLHGGKLVQIGPRQQKAVQAAGVRVGFDPDGAGGEVDLSGLNGSRGIDHDGAGLRRRLQAQLLGLDRRARLDCDLAAVAAGQRDRAGHPKGPHARHRDRAELDRQRRDRTAAWPRHDKTGVLGGDEERAEARLSAHAVRIVLQRKNAARVGEDAIRHLIKIRLGDERAGRIELAENSVGDALRGRGGARSSEIIGPGKPADRPARLDNAAVLYCDRTAARHRRYDIKSDSCRQRLAAADINLSRSRDRLNFTDDLGDQQNFRGRKRCAPGVDQHVGGARRDHGAGDGVAAQAAEENALEAEVVELFDVECDIAGRGVGRGFDHGKLRTGDVQLTAAATRRRRGERPALDRDRLLRNQGEPPRVHRQARNGDGPVQRVLGEIGVAATEAVFAVLPPDRAGLHGEQLAAGGVGSRIGRLREIAGHQHGAVRQLGAGRHIAPEIASVIDDPQRPGQSRVVPGIERVNAGWDAVSALYRDLRAGERIGVARRAGGARGGVVDVERGDRVIARRNERIHGLPAGRGREHVARSARARGELRRLQVAAAAHVYRRSRRDGDGAGVERQDLRRQSDVARAVRVDFFDRAQLRVVVPVDPVNGFAIGRDRSGERDGREAACSERDFLGDAADAQCDAAERRKQAAVLGDVQRRYREAAAGRERDFGVDARACLERDVAGSLIVKLTAETG